MDHAEKVDQDAVLRARTMLLESGRLSVARQVEAYRVLSVVSPLTYMPKLAQALLSASYASEIRDLPEAKLAWRAEAVATARRVDEGEPKRTELLFQVLDSYRLGLYELGRRAEGLAVCEEMAEAGRWGFEHGQVTHSVYGHGPLAVVLAEEGRHAEAAEICGRSVDAHRPLTPGDNSFWFLAEWAAALEAAGRQEEALDAFTELVEVARAEVAAQTTALAIQIWQLVHLAGMLDAAGRRDEAGAARREALAHLTELDLTGEPKSWSNILSWWSTLLALSGRSAEPTPSADAPGPAFGSALHQWSPDVREAYFEGLGPLEEEVEALRHDPSASLPELIALHRRLTIRTAVYRERRNHRILKPLRPVFDERVALARRLAEREELGRALTDRSMFLVAAKQYGEAYDDFREVCDVLDR
jgi:tetratricopeptide (TPR) repeat protein